MRVIHGSLVALFLSLTYPLAGFASAPPSALQTLQDQLAPYVSDQTFSGAVAYTCGAPEPVTTLVFGQCDREKGVACAADTKFRIGSMSKSFTAAAILQLAEQGRLSLDDTLSRWLPEYPAANLEKDRVQVTLRTMLDHTSGLPNWEETPFFDDHVWVKPVTLAEVLASVAQKPLVTTPGTVYAYSNTGYNLLALVVERATGTTFEQRLAEAIWRPLGLAATGITLPGQQGLAKGYAKDGDAWYSLYDQPAFTDRDLSLATGSGNIYSTAGDVMVWLRSFADGKVVSPSSVTAAITPNLNSYGYAWVALKWHDTPLAWHNGALNPLGFSSEMGFAPGSGFAYTVLTNVNNDDVSRPALDLIKSYLIDQCRL